MYPFTSKFELPEAYVADDEYARRLDSFGIMFMSWPVGGIISKSLVYNNGYANTFTIPETSPPFKVVLCCDDNAELWCNVLDLIENKWEDESMQETIEELQAKVRTIYKEQKVAAQRYNWPADKRKRNLIEESTKKVRFVDEEEKSK